MNLLGFKVRHDWKVRVRTTDNFFLGIVQRQQNPCMLSLSLSLSLTHTHSLSLWTFYRGKWSECTGTIGLSHGSRVRTGLHEIGEGAKVFFFPKRKGRKRQCSMVKEAKTGLIASSARRPRE